MINYHARHPYHVYPLHYHSPRSYPPMQGEVYGNSTNTPYAYSWQTQPVPPSLQQVPDDIGQNERQPLFNIRNPAFLKGAAIGAATAYLLSNEKVQQSLIKSSVRLWMSLQGGVEEMKERFRDAEAEIHAEEQE